MAAYCGPYSQSNDFTHMYDIRDLRGCLPIKKTCSTSLSGLVQNHPDFSHYRSMLKTSKLEGILDSPQANFTLFIPSDDALKKAYPKGIGYIDITVARHIIKSTMLDSKIISDVLVDSPASYYITKDSPNRLYVSNIGGRTYLSNCAENCGGQSVSIIHKDMYADNGIIHVVDGLLIPSVII